MVVFVDYDRRSHDNRPPRHVYAADTLQRSREKSAPLVLRTVADEFSHVTCGARSRPFDDFERSNEATNRVPSPTESEKKEKNNVSAFATALSCYPYERCIPRGISHNTVWTLTSRIF